MGNSTDLLVMSMLSEENDRKSDKINHLQRGEAMKPTNIIRIHIDGPVQSGKSAILASIRELLEKYNYCVATPDPEERNNPSKDIDTCLAHEAPRRDSVIILTESINDLANLQRGRELLSASNSQNGQIMDKDEHDKEG